MLSIVTEYILSFEELVKTLRLQTLANHNLEFFSLFAQTHSTKFVPIMAAVFFLFWINAKRKSPKEKPELQ